MSWTKVDDHNINHNWQCPICLAEADVGPDWYQDNGTPVCIECDHDMLYSHTEVDCG